MLFETNLNTIYRFKTPNTGDLMCSPSLYFDLPRNKKIDILDSDYYSSGNCIVGGGGIIHFKSRIKEVLDKCKAKNGKMAIWGAGHNIHKELFNFSFPSWIREVDLVGIRDISDEFEWVPCASCMHPIFDEKFQVIRQFGFYGHYAIPVEGVKFEIFNNEDFVKAITYLAQSELIITNSYHGVYWSTLLGKKVLAYPFSTKFFKMKHPPVLLSKNDSWSKNISFAKNYPNALHECKNANLNFYESIKKLFA